MIRVFVVIPQGYQRKGLKGLKAVAASSWSSADVLSTGTWGEVRIFKRLSLEGLVAVKRLRSESADDFVSEVSILRYHVFLNSIYFQKAAAGKRRVSYEQILWPRSGVHPFVSESFSSLRAHVRLLTPSLCSVGLYLRLCVGPFSGAHVLRASIRVYLLFAHVCVMFVSPGAEPEIPLSKCQTAVCNH
jgi:hypothetical protein